MNLNALTAISPVDGRYRRHTEWLTEYFSEYSLIGYRIRVEVEYFIALCELPLPQLSSVDSDVFPRLRGIYQNYNEEGALRVKEFEKTTNHDVKAVEYFIKEEMEKLGLGAVIEFVHFGLTSQDINNTAIPLQLKEAFVRFVQLYHDVTGQISQMADAWQDVPMLARTHGQPASPTIVGKEMNVFAVRMQQQMKALGKTPFSAKFGGATGNFNAHLVAYPHIDWNAFAVDFVNNRLGLLRSYPTTQIEHYDHLAALFDNLKRVNTILIDFSRDVWHYVSLNYFSQKIRKDEVGSSAMPHKVNPIDFENAEGNLGLANAIFEHLSAKLPISRLQRDLTDSTVLRNVGVPIAHTVIALESLKKGIGKLELNRKVIENDLSENWMVISEAIQTILRREGYPQPYEALKALTRTGEKITEQTLHDFIDRLSVSESVKNELKAISPFNYTGVIK
jgi:adenylosuccinate lyase